MSTSPPHRIIHHVADSSDWPSPVKGIARALGRPLPTYTHTGPHPFVSTNASNILRELCCGEFRRVSGEDLLYSDEKRLNDVFDIVLSTVAELRELAKWNDNGYPRPTVPIWSTMIEAVGRACSDDISIMGEVPFILPRMAPFEQCRRGTLDGVATILLCSIVNKLDRFEPPTSTSPMDVEGKSDNNYSSGKSTTEDDDVSMHYMGQSSSETSSTPSIDVPFDAHMLPGRGRRFCAILPLLCVADEENITFLLSSVLYQRRVWGIDEPVVGIVFSKTGTVGRVVLGWLDLESTDVYDLPTVNIARALSDAIPQASLGVFDLTDAESALALAQFILSLNVHFHAIITAISKPQMGTLDWRSDHIVIDDQKGDGEQCKSRVAQWARDVEMSDDSSEDSSLPHTPSSYESPGTLPVSPSVVMPNSKVPAPAPNNKGRSKRSQKPKGLQNDHGGNSAATASEAPAENAAGGIAPSDRGPPSINLPEESANKSAYSSSAFGARSAAGLADPVSISTWLFERRVLTIALIELTGDTQEIADINDKIALYHTMTKLLWPAGWLTVNTLPEVDSGVQHVRRLLFRQYEEIRKRTNTQRDKENKQHDLDTLDPAHTRIFHERLSPLLWATLGAFSLQAAALGRSVYEAEARHDWDAVLYRFCILPGQIVSPTVLLERTLQFPRNDAADGTDSLKIAASQLSLAKVYVRHCIDVQVAAFDRDVPVREQAVAALVQANAFRADLESFDAAHFLRHVRERAIPEPRTGLCDAILITPVSLGTGQSLGELKSKEYLETFGLIKTVQFTPPAHTSAADNRSHHISSSGSPSLLSPTTASSSTPSHLSKKLSPEQKKYLRNALGVSCTESVSSSTPLIPDGHSPFGSNDMWLSGFVAEYKKWAQNDAKALNQERMYLVALVTHLATLGIKEFAVFGLITSGQTGGILMAWQSERDDTIYIIERNIRTFNLSSPIEAFQFASFLIRLRKHTDTLVDLFNRRKDEFLKTAEREELPKWTKDAQETERRTGIVLLPSAGNAPKDT